MSEQPIVFEEVPGSRTTQDAVSQPKRERIAYEELQPGTEVQAGDQYRNTQGRWVEYNMDTSGVPVVGPTAMARRPHNITMMLAEFANQAEVLAEVRADEERLLDDLELLRSEYTKLQNERDELKTALRESGVAHAFTTKQGLAVCKERDEACMERDLARSEVARLSTELWARKPLEDRVASLTEELAQAREASQQLLQAITDNADQFAWANKTLEQQRDEARAEVQRLQEVVNNLHSEPTARQVQQMLRTWATELDWSSGCFDSAGREQIDTIQKTLIAVIERIESIVNPEGGTDDN